MGLEKSLLRELRLPADRKLGNLSHGMRLKMALACALPFRPRLLVLDEPFSGLDPLVRDEFMEGLLGQAGDMTILISSHELGEIDGVATHVAFLDEGKLLFQESMSDLVGRFREVHVTLDGNGKKNSGITNAPFPKGWLRIQTVGNVLSFVDTEFSEGDVNERLRSLIGSVKAVDAQPMTLRRIFTTLAWASREGALQ